MQIANQTVRGRIEWDESKHERMPMLVIDGREVSWEEFGRMPHDVREVAVPDGDP